MDSLVIDKVVSSVLSTKKYRYLYEPTIRRTVEELATRYPEKKLDKEAKKKLHQLWGAYFPTRPNFIKLLSEIEADIAAAVSNEDLMKPLLRLQTSTDERLPIINEFYKKIFNEMPSSLEIKSIVEYGAGMNTMTYSWIATAFGNEVEYTGVDVDSELANFQNSVFKLLNQDSKAKAVQGDILVDELISADVTFLFKLLPLLEHQEKGSAKRILSELPSKVVVVSFPTRSIGGKEKGMLANYREMMNNSMYGESFNQKEIILDSESIFILIRR